MKIKITPGAVSFPLESEKHKTGDWGTHYPVIDREKCDGCGTCEQYCPDSCIEIKKTNEEKYAVVDYDFCKGCGICSTICPKEAIRMELKEIYRV